MSVFANRGKRHSIVAGTDFDPCPLSFEFIFFRHMKLELLTKIPASNDETIFIFMKYTHFLNLVMTSAEQIPQNNPPASFCVSSHLNVAAVGSFCFNLLAQFAGVLLVQGAVALEGADCHGVAVQDELLLNAGGACGLQSRADSLDSFWGRAWVNNTMVLMSITFTYQVIKIPQIDLHLGLKECALFYPDIQFAPVHAHIERWHFNFLDVVPRYRDPQRQVTENLHNRHFETQHNSYYAQPRCQTPDSNL